MTSDLPSKRLILILAPIDTGAILRATEFGDGHQRYCRQAPGAIPTAEIFVVYCGKIMSVPAPFLTWYAEAVTSKAGYELVSRRLQTFARCHHKDEADSCQRCANGDAHNQTTAVQ